MTLIKVKSRGTDNVSSRRNLMVNGAMNVAQRGTSFATAANGAYTIDQFRYGKGNDGEITITQDSSSPSGFANSLKVDVTTADTSIAAGQYADIFTRVEAQNLQVLNFGTSDAQNFTLSFYVKSNKTGTYSVNIGQSDNSFKQATLTYTIDSADTWERKSLTFTGDTAGVIDDNADRGLEILWWLAAGSTYTSGSASGTFSSFTNANHAAGHAVNLLDSTDNEWFLTGVQLEVGDSASDFDHRLFAEDLELCKRYYQKVTTGENNGPIALGTAYNSSQLSVPIPLHPEMRATPTVDIVTGSNYYRFTSNASNTNFDTLALDIATTKAIIIFKGSLSGMTGGNAGYLYTKSTSAYVAFAAEL